MKRWLSLLLSAWLVLSCCTALPALAGELFPARGGALQTGVRFYRSFEEDETPSENVYLEGSGVYKLNYGTGEEPGPVEPEPVAGAEVDLSTITANPHYSNHVVTNLFDGDTGTKYLVMSSSTATISFSLTSSVVLTTYALTSANDHDPRDPKDWDLYGSENGEDWVLLDSRRDEDFETRFQTNVYVVDNTDSFLWYKLDVLSNNGKDAVGMNIVQLAELTMNPPYSGEDTETGFTVVKSSIDGTAGLSGEEKINLFDRNPQTKFVAQSASMWVSFRIAEPETVTAYRMVSANDWPERDPKTWTVYGSDDGQNWTEIDHQSGQVFSERYQTKFYRFSESVCYAWYKLEVTEKYGSNSYLQLADFTLLTATEVPEYEEGMEALEMANAAWTGARSLEVSGVQLGKTGSFARALVFDGLEIPVYGNTFFSYMVRPVLADENAYDFEYTSCRVMIDLHFTDGTTLSGLALTDENGSEMTPAGQADGECTVVGQWNLVRCALGAAEGKTIDRIDAYFEKGSAAADSPFIAQFDDLKIEDRAENTYDHLSDYINILRGTYNDEDLPRGGAVPAVTVPNGFNSYVPVTDPSDASACYDYRTAALDSISVLHAPSGEAPYGSWQFMANTSVDPSGQLTASKISSAARAASFSHENEAAHAHLYSVTLDEDSPASGVKIEIVPTSHAAYVRFTFPADADHVNVIFDSLWGDGILTFKEDGKSFTAITGHTSSGSGMMRISGSFDTAWASAQTTASKKALISFAPGTTVLTMKIATSFINYDRASHSMELEIGNKSFDETLLAAQSIWEDLCSIVEIEGASENELISFYSSLYRMYSAVNLRSENAGSAEEPSWVYASPYGGTKEGVLYTNDDFSSSFALWAGYMLLTPEKSGDMLDGILRHYLDAGWLAGSVCPGATEASGTGSDALFADALVKGVNFDSANAWESMLKNASAYSEDPLTGGRTGGSVSPYLGYLPDDGAESFTRSAENWQNDYCLYRAALILGMEEEAEYYRGRCLAYALLYNEYAGFFMGRSATGVFSAGASDLDPTAWGGPANEYIDSNAYGNVFPAAFDGAGVAALYGGEEALTAKLDALFDESGEGLPEYAERGNRVSKEVRMGQYAHNSISSHRLIYAYAFSDAPYKAGAYIREALRHLYTGSEIGQGYIGSDLSAAQSAWYVFSSLGFYPFSPATGEYLIGSPLFDRVTLHLEGGDLVIEAQNNSSENVYVRSAAVNGQPLDRVYLTHGELTSGGTVVFNMGSTPGPFGSSSSGRPYSVTASGSAPAAPVDLTNEAVFKSGAYNGQQAKIEAEIYSDLANVKKLFDNDSLTTAEIIDGAQIVLTGTAPGVAAYITLTCDLIENAPASVVVEASDNGVVWKKLAEKDLNFFWDRSILPVIVPEALRGSYRSYRLTFSGGTALAEIEICGAQGEVFENPFGHFVYGDVNLDGAVSISDVTALLDYLSLPAERAEELCAEGAYLFSANDLNNDGMVSVSDVTTLLDLLAGALFPDPETPSSGPEPFEPSDAYDSIDERVAVTVDYTDPAGQSFEGSVTVTVLDASACGRYTVYYADDEGILDGVKKLGSVNASSAGVTYTVFTAGALTAPPSGAKAVALTNGDGLIVAYEEIPMVKRARGGALYGSFAAVSDVHVFNNEPYGGGYDNINGDEDLVRAVEAINAAGVDFTAITGDLILSFMDDETQINAELIKCTGILAGLDAPYYAVKGNHDKKVDEAVWKELTGCDLDYAFTCGGARFIFLSLKTVPNVGSVDEAPYGQAKLDWLRSELTKNAGRRVLLFMHYPIAGYAGLVPGNSYGFSSGSAEEAQLLAMIKDHGNVTAFNGHTHYDFASSATYPGINVSPVDQLHSYFVHLPSVAYPRNASNTTVTEESEGYIVRLYENGLLLEGMDFVTGEFDPAAICYLDTRPADNGPVNDTMLLAVGESAEIETKAPCESAAFRSSDESVVTVSAAGVVTAVAPGSATVFCDIDGVTYRVTVRVVDADGAMSGSGTESDPYILTTAEHFVYIQNEFRSGNSLAGVYFAMGCDICLNDSVNYRPAVSSEAGTFAGYFDGRGHVLSATTSMSAEDFAVPYFYHVTGTVVNVVFDCMMGGCAKTSYVVARTLSGGKLVNCVVRGSVYASNVNTSIVCGTSSKATIANCFIDVAVTGTTPGASESGITMKGSGTVVNNLYVANGCTAHFGETEVSSLDGVAATMNSTLASSASSAGIAQSTLCAWTTDAQGNPTLVAR